MLRRREGGRGSLDATPDSTSKTARAGSLIAILIAVACAAGPTPEERSRREQQAKEWDELDRRVATVRLTKNPDVTKGCAFLSNVKAPPVDYAAREKARQGQDRTNDILYGSRRRTPALTKESDAQSDARAAAWNMQRQTLDLGGNVLFVLTDFPNAAGEAYRCPPPAP